MKQKIIEGGESKTENLILEFTGTGNYYFKNSKDDVEDHGTYTFDDIKKSLVITSAVGADAGKPTSFEVEFVDNRLLMKSTGNNFTLQRL